MASKTFRVAHHALVLATGKDSRGRILTQRVAHGTRVIMDEADERVVYLTKIGALVEAKGKRIPRLRPIREIVRLAGGMKDPVVTDVEQTGTVGPADGSEPLPDPIVKDA